jgi:hypothetical protein
MQLVCMAFAVAVVLAIRIGFVIQMAIWKLVFHAIRGACKLVWWLARLVGRGIACLFRWVCGRVAARRAAKLPAAEGTVPQVEAQAVSPAIGAARV